MKIVWSPLAVERAADIAEYIANDNRNAAENWIREVFRRVEQLETIPESGRIVPEIGNKSFRELIYGNYRIIYRLEDTRIVVLTVRHGRQILPVDEIAASNAENSP